MWEIIRTGGVSSGTPSAGGQDSDRLQPRPGGPLGPEFPSRRPAVPRKAGTPFRREKSETTDLITLRPAPEWWLCMWTHPAAAGEPGLGAFWKPLRQFPQWWGLFSVGRYQRKRLQQPAGVLYYSIRWETIQPLKHEHNHVSTAFLFEKMKLWSLFFCPSDPQKPVDCVRSDHTFGFWLKKCFFF